MSQSLPFRFTVGREEKPARPSGADLLADRSRFEQREGARHAGGEKQKIGYAK